LEKLHPGQMISNFVPHLPQNCIPSGFSNWHFGHCILCPPKKGGELPDSLFFSRNYAVPAAYRFACFHLSAAVFHTRLSQLMALKEL
jgi:hypothetical protein